MKQLKEWGDNATGIWGDGTDHTLDADVATPQDGFTFPADVVDMDARHECAIFVLSDGTAWGSGYEEFGQLTGVPDTFHDTAEQLPSLPSGRLAVKCAAGYYTNYLIANDGTLWAMGRNQHGQIGDGTTTNRTTWTQCGSLAGVVDVAAGQDVACAALNDGTAYSWGYNNLGNAGVGDIVNANIVNPTQLPGLANIIQVSSADLLSGAVGSDGFVYTWGGGGAGSLGDGSSDLIASSPRTVSGISTGTMLAIRINGGTVLLADGTLVSWGAAVVGDGSSGVHSSPVAIPVLTGIVSVFTGIEYTIVASLAQSWAWGRNNTGQLGIGSFGGPYLFSYVLDPTEMAGDVGGMNLLALAEFAGLGLSVEQPVGWVSNQLG